MSGLFASSVYFAFDIWAMAAARPCSTADWRSGRRRHREVNNTGARRESGRSRGKCFVLACRRLPAMKQMLADKNCLHLMPVRRMSTPAQSPGMAYRARMSCAWGEEYFLDG